MNTEKAIEAIQELQNELRQINTTGDFNSWLSVARETLTYCILNSDNPMPMSTAINWSGNVLNSETKSKAQKILAGHISNLERFGYRDKEVVEAASPVSVAVNQHNNQNQSTVINNHLTIIFDAISDELNGKQLKELKAILEADIEPDEKKKTFMDKLKGFGENVASNILANIVCNPDIYSSLLTM